MDDDTNFARIACWFGIGIALLLLFELIDPFFGFLILIPAALVYLVSAAVLLVRYVRTAIKKRSRKAWMAVASIPASLVALVLMTPLIATFMLYAEFAVKLPAYSRIVEALSKAPPSERFSGSTDPVKYIVDSGPPVRVAFPKWGIIDNWTGIIYDPSDAVAAATGWSFETGEQRFTGPPKIRGLFGGDLVGCRHLYDHYYSCSFT